MKIEKFIQDNEDILSIFGIEKKLRMPPRTIPQAQRHEREFPEKHRKKLIAFFRAFGAKARQVR